MITTFNKYNLILEKSSLSHIIKDNEFIKLFYKYFNHYVSDQLEIEEQNNTKDFSKNLRLYHNGMINDGIAYIFIIDENIYILYYSNNTYYILYYNQGTNRLDTYNTSKNIDEICNNLDSIFNVNYNFSFKIYMIIKGISMHKTLYWGEEPEVERLAKLFLFIYKNSFEKYIERLKSIYNTRIVMMNIEMNLFSIRNKYLDLKIKKLYEDIKTLNSFYRVYFLKSDNVLSTALHTIDAENLKILKYNSYEKVSKEYENKLLLELRKTIFIRLIDKLSYKKQYLANIELEKNPSVYKDVKDDLYDKEMLDKWKHLDDANNFDLL